MLDFIYKGIASVMYEKLANGDDWNYVEGNDYSRRLKMTEYAQKHPIMTTAVDFVGQLFSRAEFWVERNGKRVDDHWLIDLLNEPGFELTRSDFLRAVFFDSVTTGVSEIIPVKAVGFDKPTKLRIINPLKVEYPTISINDYKVGNYDEYEITLDKEVENSKFKVNEVIFIRDLALTPTNVETKGGGYDMRFLLTSNSRFDAQLQVLYNTVLSLEAKEIILKTNGKELYSSKAGENANLGNTERDDIKTSINNNYGLARNRSRAIITKAALDWKSLHIAMRDLGLDDSLKVDAKLIFGALQIPSDIMSLDLKKSSYQNQKESIVAYYQNILQTKVDDFAASLGNRLLAKGEVLRGGYDHLPVMKYILDQKYKGIKELAIALKNLQDAGMKWKDALRILEIDESLEFELSKLTQTQSNNEGEGQAKEEGEDGQGTSSTDSGSADEEDE